MRARCDANLMIRLEEGIHADLGVGGVELGECSCRGGEVGMIDGFDSVQAVKESGEHGEKGSHLLQFLPSQKGFLGECGILAIPFAIPLPSDK